MRNTGTKSDLNGCNNRINIPEYNIENKALVPRDNVIEFTPDKEGNYIYTCWMGMLHGYVKVVDDINKVNLDEIKNEVGNYRPAAGSAGGCCGG